MPSRMWSVLEGSGEKSVHNYVSVSSDGGSEMRVQRNAQGVMPLVCRVRVLGAEVPSPLQSWIIYYFNKCYTVADD
jgi:hypothetical protein